jgi:hypothetical protein
VAVLFGAAAFVCRPDLKELFLEQELLNSFGLFQTALPVASFFVAK